jgi:hypothetical protein
MLVAARSSQDFAFCSRAMAIDKAKALAGNPIAR